MPSRPGSHPRYARHAARSSARVENTASGSSLPGGSDVTVVQHRRVEELEDHLRLGAVARQKRQARPPGLRRPRPPPIAMREASGRDRSTASGEKPAEAPRSSPRGRPGRGPSGASRYSTAATTHSALTAKRAQVASSLRPFPAHIRSRGPQRRGSTPRLRWVGGSARPRRGAPGPGASVLRPRPPVRPASQPSSPPSSSPRPPAPRGYRRTRKTRSSSPRSDPSVRGPKTRSVADHMPCPPVPAKTPGRRWMWSRDATPVPPRVARPVAARGMRRAVV